MEIERTSGGDVYGELAINGLPFNPPSDEFDVEANLRGSIEEATRRITAYVQQDLEDPLAGDELAALRKLTAKYCGNVVGAINSVVGSNSVELKPPIVLLTKDRLANIIEERGQADPHPEVSEFASRTKPDAVVGKLEALLSMGLVPGVEEEPVDDLVSRGLTFVGVGADLMEVIDAQTGG